jgi:MoaA/NifB/PqqE/SkfB family radical SAM enzyme
MSLSHDQGGLTFERSRYRPKPRHPDWARLSQEARTLAREIRPGLELPRRGPAEWKRRARAVATASRNYLENRRRARQGREDLWPLYFIWTTLRSCNFLCEYCDDHQGRRYPELSRKGELDTASGLKLLRVMRTRTPSVYFAGGEPTLRPDLPELVRAARDLDYWPITVNTNGSLFHARLRKPSWRTFLADVDILVISLDALDLELLGKLWKTKHPEQVVTNLLLVRELAREQRVKLMVNTVVQPGLIGEARAVLDLACDLEIGFCGVPKNAGPRIDPEVLRDPDYPAFVRTLLARKQKGFPIVGSLEMNRRLFSATKLECRNSLKPHVDHDGRLAWPCKASVNVKPTMLDVLAYDDVEGLYAAACALESPTGFHGDGPDQCGASCNWAQNYTTDEYARGLVRPDALIRAAVSFISG